MAFDITLFLLFIVLVILIFFGDDIITLFKGKEKFERRERGKTKPPSVTPKKPHEKPRKKPVSPPAKPEEKIETVTKPEKKPTVVTFEPPKPKPRPTPPVKPAEEVPRVEKKLPDGKYPDFDNSRLLGMGLSQEDADTFVLELIGQIDDHIPQIEEALKSGEYEKVERLSHSIKGSATNLGTGGVADLLVDFNTYCKSGKDKEIIEAYLELLKKYNTILKSQFS